MLWVYLGSSVLVLWLIFNWLVPISILRFTKPMSLGRIPADILRRAGAHKVAYYTADLQGGYAFSIWLVRRYAVVLNRQFLAAANPAQIRFVLAHELGHCALGHIRFRWLMVVTGLILVPGMKRIFKRHEDQADQYAARLSGLPREVLTNRDLGVVIASALQPTVTSKQELFDQGRRQL